jgi:hypothetical protein
VNLTIHYEVTDTGPELEEALEEIVAEEARGFAESLRRRLAAEGVSDLTMNLKESRT